MITLVWTMCKTPFLSDFELSSRVQLPCDNNLCWEWKWPFHIIDALKGACYLKVMFLKIPENSLGFSFPDNAYGDIVCMDSINSVCV